MAGNNKGIYRRGKIYWICYAGLDGKIHRESARTTKSREAEAILTSRRNAVLEGKEPAIKKISNPYFYEVVEKYREIFALQKSYRFKKYLLNQLVNEFGNLKLTDFTVDLVERFVAKMQTEGLKSASPRVVFGKKKTLKPASVNRLLAALRHVFTKAYDWDMCSDETLKRIRKVKLLKENNQRTEFLSIDQCNDLLNACHSTKDTRYLKPIISFALNTGCRKEEILGLKWEDVDMVHSIITLRNTKNGETRMVPINSALLASLEGIVRNISSPYVFCDVDGKRYGDIRKTFNKVCNRAGVEWLRFHDLRHTFASHLVMSGVDINTVSKLLGHKSLTMTLRYSHLAQNHLDNAVENLAKRFKNGTAQLLHNQNEKRVYAVA